LGLIDEYRARVYPVLVGGGIPFFPARERRVDPKLLESRTFSSGDCRSRAGLGRLSATMWPAGPVLP
jgi:dihydrofolate reductase